jgi:hypothetical protein
MLGQPQQFQWHTIGRVVALPGIYAWYYKPQLSDHDIEALRAQVSVLSLEDAATRVRDFLKRHIFDPLADGPFSATIGGALKPTYEGDLHVRTAVSEDLVARIAANPERLRQLKSVLEVSAPEFSSPIYIGMAMSLRRRLERHKALICRLKDSADSLADLDQPSEEDDQRTHSFAQEVVRRQLDVNRLIVVIKQVNVITDEYKDAENILNRLNFPICGRN